MGEDNNNTEYGDDDENKKDMEDLKIHLESIPLGLLLEELGRRSDNYAYAFVDERINAKEDDEYKPIILHFKVEEKFPGSMGQFLKSLYESSKELSNDYIVRSLQCGTRYSAVGRSDPEENEKGFD